MYVYLFALSSRLVGVNYMQKIRGSAYERFMRQRLVENPQARLLFQESNKSLNYYRGSYVGLTQVMKELRCGKGPLLRILDKEGITIIRVAARERHYCFIEPGYLPELKRRYAGELAREKRMRN